MSHDSLETQGGKPFIHKKSLHFVGPFRAKIFQLENSLDTLSPPQHQSSSSVPGSKTSTLQRDRRRRSLNIRAMAASVSSSSGKANGEVQLLNGVYDKYGGVVVQMTKSMDSKLFASLIKSSLSHWKQEGKKGVWIKMPIELVNLVEVAVKEGFWYHHAEPTYLMLVNWIPGGAITLPANASHRVVVGAFVMNEKREVLVVQENRGRFRGTGIWKFPTGVVDQVMYPIKLCMFSPIAELYHLQGEDIYKAVVREVKEETSIDAEFVEVLSFRQSHQSFFGKSDLFFMCMMRPLSFDIQKQENEIEAAQWMLLEEYMAQPFVQKEGHLKHMISICLAKLEGGGYSGFSPVPATSTFSDQNGYLYYNVVDLKTQ